MLTSSPGRLFDALCAEPVEIAPGAWWLPGFASDEAETLLHEIGKVLARAPLRHMHTPGGRRMSVAMSNCGRHGWVSDRAGYRYSATDPVSGRAWPPLPPRLSLLAGRAAKAAGYPGFAPDACLINRYVPGARMGLHQDRDERDLTAPIVSISLGAEAVFLFGGPTRSDRYRRIPLAHGDVVVWGGPSRLFFHGVAPLAAGAHPLTGACRFNLTLRKAGD